jgi:hypothetical protein
LYLLEGNRGAAREAFERGSRTNPRDLRLQDYRQALEKGCPPDPLARWTGRFQRRPACPSGTALRVAVAVWGEQYIDVFMRANLRSLLTPGNLHNVAARMDVRLTLYTRPEDVPLFTAYPQWRELTDLATVEIIPLDQACAAMGFKATCKYSLMTACHNDALERSRLDGAMTYLVMSDLLHCDGFMRYGLDRLLEGAASVIYPAGLRFRADDILAALEVGPANAILGVTPPELFSFAKDLIHPASRNNFFSDRFCVNPGALMWQDGGGDVLFHDVFKNPLFFSPLSEPLRMNSTLDVDLVYQATDGGLGTYHLIRDFGRIVALELTSNKDLANFHAPVPVDRYAMSHWIFNNTDQTNRSLSVCSAIYRGVSDTVSPLEAFKPEASRQWVTVLP